MVQLFVTLAFCSQSAFYLFNKFSYQWSLIALTGDGHGSYLNVPLRFVVHRHVTIDISYFAFLSLLIPTQFVCNSFKLILWVWRKTRLQVSLKKFPILSFVVVTNIVVLIIPISHRFLILTRFFFSNGLTERSQFFSLLVIFISLWQSSDIHQEFDDDYYYQHYFSVISTIAGWRH